MKVHPSLETSFIPMEASDFEALQKQKRKRDEHWSRMRNARTYWMTKHQLRSMDDNFWLWLRDEYGLVPHRTDDGNLTEDYNVVDEKKYLLFLLRFDQ